MEDEYLDETGKGFFSTKGCGGDRCHRKKTQHDSSFQTALKMALKVDEYAAVTEMPWNEVTPPYRQGCYSGNVDHKMRPHGKGCWAIYNQEDGSVGKDGWWYEGK